MLPPVGLGAGFAPVSALGGYGSFSAPPPSSATPCAAALAAVEQLIRLQLIDMMIRIEFTQKYKIDLVKIKCKYEHS
jgi:hypothetical protein